MIIGFGKPKRGVTKGHGRNQTRATERSARASGAKNDADAAAPGRRPAKPLLADGNGAIATSSVVGTKVPRRGLDANPKLTELHGQGVPQGGVPDESHRLAPNNPKATPRNLGPRVPFRKLDELIGGFADILCNEGGGAKDVQRQIVDVDPQRNKRPARSPLVER